MIGVTRLILVLFVGLATAAPALAADEAQIHNFWAWPPTTFHSAFTMSTLFGVLGIILALVGFKLFDWLTPGSLQREVIENKNMAAAIITAAMIIGICNILAAAVH